MTASTTILTVPTETPAYLNAKAYWAKIRMDTVSWLDRDVYTEYEAAVVVPFRAWLAEQGAVIVEHRSPDYTHGVDSYNVAVGHDVLQFGSNAERMMFMLKWT